jgi:hypothetical protein
LNIFSPVRGSGEAEGVDEQNTQDSSPSVQNDNDSQDDEELEDGEETPELIISEVYYDGKDERIEIFNI